MVKISDKSRSIVLAAVMVTAIAMALSPSVWAQLDLTCDWEFAANGLLPGESLPCQGQGSLELTQNGSSISGQLTWTLEQGPNSCPPQLAMNVNGTVSGSSISGIGDGSTFGMAAFQGVVAQDSSSMTGEFAFQTGSFVGTVGDWTANCERQRQVVPTITHAGLLTLILLLVSAGLLILRWQQRI